MVRETTFSSFSFGCRVNHAEREEIDRQMVTAGFLQVEERPDIFIVNTCSVTHKAEREARQLIYKTKRENPAIKVVVTGCSATYWLKTGTYTKLPIDLLVDNTNKEYLVKLLQKKLLTTKKTGPVASSSQSVLGRLRAAWDPLRSRHPSSDKFLSSGRMVVKIQDGCHRFCSFCIVPHLRGLPKSTKISHIVNLIKQYDAKIREIILTAINTEAYGKDTGEKFLDLINSILQTTKVERLSFGSVHPWSLTPEFIEFIKNHPESKRIVKFFHVPLQSGSNRVLQLMNRRHTREDMMDRVKLLSKAAPSAFIATDIIVGYLEETDDDFADTYKFLEESPISKFHVFRFSKRTMTAAFYMARRLQEPSEKTKQERSIALRELSDKKFKAFQKKLIGYQSAALFLKSKDETQEVLLDNQIPVYIQKSRVEEGSIKTVEVAEYKKGKLFGRIVR